MSADIAQFAEQCPGLRTGPPMATATIVAAHYLKGVWTIQMKGLWRFHSPAQVPPAGYPTRPPWQVTEFVTDCTVNIDAARVLDTGGMSASGFITATPP
jgi:hypothetical protein